MLNFYDEKLKKKEAEESETVKKKNDKNLEVIKRKMFFIAGNITKSSLILDLENNEGAGMLFETEADTITSANRSEHGNFTDILRQGFENESIQSNRVSYERPIYIQRGKFSVVISSTIGQLYKLIPDYENGLFSRFCYYILPDSNKFEGRYFNKESNAQNTFKESLSSLFLKIGTEHLKSAKKLQFELPEAIQKLQNHWFDKLANQFLDQHPKLNPNAKRMGDTFNRLCMLFSFLRQYGQAGYPNSNTITCASNDALIAIKIIEKLARHLQILDWFYKNNTQAYKTPYIPSNTHENKSHYSKEMIKESLEYIEQGNSYRDAARKFLGDSKLSGTMNKWHTKAKKNPAFLFPETETGNNILANVKSSLQNTNVSLFADLDSEEIIGELNLYKVLTSNYYKEDIVQLRSEKKLASRKTHIQNLPAFTPAGNFDILYGEKLKLVEKNNFLVLYINHSENLEVANFKNLKNELKNIINVVACIEQPQGNDLYILFHMANNEDRPEYITALEAAFKSLGIKVSFSEQGFRSRCYVTYDTEAYIAKYAKSICTNILDVKKDIDFVSITK